MDDRTRGQCGRLLGIALFQNHHCGYRSRFGITEDAEIVAVSAFTGEIAQLWRIDQLTDGTYRIMPKAVYDYPLALTAVGVSTPSLAKFDPKSDKGRWNLKKP